MTKRKKKNRKRLIITISTIVSLLIVSLLTQILIHNNNVPVIYSRNKNYFKGSIYSPNAAANLLDSLYNGENILISPLNANIALANFYNGSDNKSEKEISKYFNNDKTATNNNLLNKLQNLKIKNNNKKKEKYEKYIGVLFSRNYNNLKNQDISRLSQKDKEELVLIIRKIELFFNQSTNKMKDKDIEKYSLSDKERAYNSYVIKEKIDSILVQYENYIINNNITNYNELYIDNNKRTKIEKNYLDITQKYNTKITTINYNDKTADETINNHLLTSTNNSIFKIFNSNNLTSKDIISINSLTFNSKWKNIFQGEYNVAEEFTDYEENHYLVDVMYSEEKYYYENDEAYGFAKDFEDEKYSFVGILPKENKEFRVSTLNLESFLETKKTTKVSVGIPKFKIESTNNLIDLFKKENINGIFADSANLHLISDKELKVGVMLQQESLTIGEYGTAENKVKNSPLSTKTSEKDSKRVVLNKPFVFLIINNETNDVLLIGRFNRPNQK